MKNYIFIFVITGAVFLFPSCKEVLYNDLIIQGDWERICEVDYIKTLMHIKIDSDNFYYKQADAEDWEGSFPCSASFGVVYLDTPVGELKAKYAVLWKKAKITGLSYEDGFMWLNGSWEKQ